MVLTAVVTFFTTVFALLTTVLAALNLIDAAGNVDVEKIYQHLKPAAAKCHAAVTLPIVGTLTFTEQDVDSLYSHIMQG